MLRALIEDKYVVPSVLTLAGGVWLIWLGLSMPHPRGWASAPGLFPIIIGACLASLAVCLHLEGRTRRARAGHGRRKDTSDTYEIVAAGLRPAGTFALVLLYVFGLLAVLPYEIATALFLAVALLLNGVRSWRIVLCVSLGASAVIGFVFVLGVETLLPGQGSLVEHFFYR